MRGIQIKKIQVTPCVIPSVLNLLVTVFLLSQVPTWFPTSSCYCSSASRCSSWSWQWVRGSDAAALGFGTMSTRNWGASASPVWWWVPDGDLMCVFFSPPNNHLIAFQSSVYWVVFPGTRFFFRNYLASVVPEHGLSMSSHWWRQVPTLQAVVRHGQCHFTISIYRVCIQPC